MRILVTGASGFAGALIVPRLIDQGHAVRALARNADALSGPAEAVGGDALTGSGLERALDGVEVAYYLIHSMEHAPQQARFDERERVAAENFAAAASRAGVARIVYLGGMLPANGAAPEQAALSRHLASRAQVERILLAAVPDSVALRASIVIGARSRSFRLLVHLVERLPVLPLPAWRRFRTQPIDARDIAEMLIAAATAPLGGRSLDAPGPDVLSYGEIVRRIAELMLVGRPAMGLGLNATPVAARVAAAIAGEDPALVIGLMESLQMDLVVRSHVAADLLGVALHSFDAAVEHALGEWEQAEPLAAR